MVAGLVAACRALVLADVLPPAVLALAPDSLVLADVRPVALLAPVLPSLLRAQLLLVRSIHILVLVVSCGQPRWINIHLRVRAGW